MPNVKFMEKLNRAEKLLRQFPHGIRAVDFARKLGISRQYGYDFLNALEVRGKARSQHGLWFPKDKKTKVEGKNILYFVRSGFGFFDWLKHRAEMREMKRLELRARLAARMETLENMLVGEEFSYVKFEENLHKHRKKYGLEP